MCRLSYQFHGPSLNVQSRILIGTEASRQDFFIPTREKKLEADNFVFRADKLINL